MLIPARFTSVGHAYEVCLQLLTTSLAESPAGQGSAPGDDLVALQRQLARLCAALLAKDWRKVPVVPEALIAWRREERELQLARQVREEAAVPAASGPTADELIEQVSATKIPLRFRKAKALRAPKLGAQRTLLSLLQAMPVGTIQRTCEALLGGRARDKATAVEALQGAFERRSALRSAMAFLGEVERVILAALLKVGGELPLADLPAGMGPPLRNRPAHYPLPTCPYPTHRSRHPHLRRVEVRPVLRPPRGLPVPGEEVLGNQARLADGQ